MTSIGLGVLTGDEAVSLRAHKAVLCKALRPEIVAVCKGLGLDDGVIWRPIAKDWKTFNKGDNFGEVLDTGRYLTGEC